MKRFLLVIAASCFAASGMAQIGIGTTSPQAALDVSSTTQGILIPRMTTAQRNAMSSPVTSTMVYDTSLGEYYYYTGTGWTVLVPKPDSKIYQIFRTDGSSTNTYGSSIAWTSVAGQGTALSYSTHTVTLPANKTFMITGYVASASAMGYNSGARCSHQVVDATDDGTSNFIFSTQSHVDFRVTNPDQWDTGLPALAMIKTGSSAKTVKLKAVINTGSTPTNTSGAGYGPETMLIVQEL